MDAFHKMSTKDHFNGISCGDGWNSNNYGHTKRRTKGRQKLRKAARARLKRVLARFSE